VKNLDVLFEYVSRRRKNVSWIFRIESSDRWNPVVNRQIHVQREGTRSRTVTRADATPIIRIG